MTGPKGPLASVRRFVQEQRRGLLLTAALVLSVQFLEFHGFFSGAEGKIANWAIRLMSAGDHTDAEFQVHAVAIDDRTYQEFFGSRSPLEPSLVMQIVDALVETAPPAALGVDLLTDDIRYQSLSKHATQVPIIWASDARPPALDGVRHPMIDAVSFPEWLVGLEDHVTILPGNVLGRPPSDEVRWGIPVFPQDEDGIVRRVWREWWEWQPVGEEPRRPQHNTFGRCIAAALEQASCEQIEGPPHYFFVNDTARSTPSKSVSDLFECVQHDESLCFKLKPKDGALSSLRNAVVVLGATFHQARDRYATVASKDQPGLELNALAIRSEHSKQRFHELYRPAVVILDFVTGFAIVFLFSRSSRSTLKRIGVVRPNARVAKHLPVWAPVTAVVFRIVPAVAVLFLALLFLCHTIWISVAAILLTGIGWHVVAEILEGRHHALAQAHAAGHPTPRRKGRRPRRS